MTKIRNSKQYDLDYLPTEHTNYTKKHVHGKITRKIIYADESYKIIGACFNVYKQKGCGFLEPVYQECTAIEFEFQRIPLESQKELTIMYRGHKLEKTYKPDFICFQMIIVEIKAVSTLTDEHRSQILNYLHATGLKLGLLINYEHYPKMEYERYVI